MDILGDALRQGIAPAIVVAIYLIVTKIIDNRREAAQIKLSTELTQSIKTDNEICEMCAKESEEPEKNIAQEENGCCCYRRTTARSQDERKKLMNRLSRIEGQIRGIKGMLEKDAYCNDILIQSAAVSAAMNAFNRELLSSHIHSCVVRDIREGKDEVVDELMATLQKLMK